MKILLCPRWSVHRDAGRQKPPPTPCSSSSISRLSARTHTFPPPSLLFLVGRPQPTADSSLFRFSNIYAIATYGLVCYLARHTGPIITLRPFVLTLITTLELHSGHSSHTLPESTLSGPSRFSPSLLLHVYSLYRRGYLIKRRR